MEEKRNILIFLLIIIVALYFMSKKTAPIGDEEKITDMRINLNEDSSEIIQRLPFIGEKKAEKIIKAREKEILTPRSLKKLLGEKTFSKISSKVGY